MKIPHFTKPNNMENNGQYFEDTTEMNNYYNNNNNFESFLRLIGLLIGVIVAIVLINYFPDIVKSERVFYGSGGFIILYLCYKGGVLLSKQISVFPHKYKRLKEAVWALLFAIGVIDIIFLIVNFIHK